MLLIVVETYLLSADWFEGERKSSLLHFKRSRGEILGFCVFWKISKTKLELLLSTHKHMVIFTGSHLEFPLGVIWKRKIQYLILLPHYNSLTSIAFCSKNWNRIGCEKLLRTTSLSNMQKINWTSPHAICFLIVTFFEIPKAKDH